MLLLSIRLVCNKSPHGDVYRDRTAKIISIIETWRAQRKETYLARFGFGNAPSQFRSLTIAKDPRKWGKVVVIIHKLLRAPSGPVL